MMTLERLDWLLANWADFMRQPSSKLGYPSKSLCLATGGGSSDDEFDAMCDEVDTQCAQAIDSIIDSITLPQRTAINHQWLNVAHHYPTQELDLVEALENIIRLANKRGLQ
jgi:hypothetical protein